MSYGYVIDVLWMCDRCDVIDREIIHSYFIHKFSESGESLLSPPFTPPHTLSHPYSHTHPSTSHTMTHTRSRTHNSFLSKLYFFTSLLLSSENLVASHRTQSFVIQFIYFLHFSPVKRMSGFYILL